MANNSYTQQALAVDPNFLTRVRGALATVAWQVIEEPSSTPSHAQRAAYARQVINNVALQAQSIAGWLVQRPNLFQFETTYNFQAGSVVTAAGDPDIESQLMSDWNDLAGVTG